MLFYGFDIVFSQTFTDFRVLPAFVALILVLRQSTMNKNHIGFLKRNK